MWYTDDLHTEDTWRTVHAGVLCGRSEHDPRGKGKKDGDPPEPVPIWCVGNATLSGTPRGA